MYSHISSKSAYVTNIVSDVGKKHLLQSLTGKGNGCYHEIFEEPKVTIFFLLMHLLAQLLQGPAGVKLYGLESQRLQIVLAPLNFYRLHSTVLTKEPNSV